MKAVLLHILHISQDGIISNNDSGMLQKPLVLHTNEHS